MKKMLLLATMAMMLLQACDDYHIPGHNDSVYLNETVTDFIAEKYSGARIIESEYDNGYLEVEIYHGNREKTVRFNTSDAWVDTHWNIRKSELPQSVEAAVKASAYGSYRIDDVEYYQTPDGDYCKIEFERGERDVTLRVKIDGTVM